MTLDADDQGGPGSVSSAQKGAAPLTVFAAPATGAEFNTLGERLVPKACFKVEDLLFDFDSSFVKPEIETHLPRLAQLRTDNTAGALSPPLSVFGHADPVGNDVDNKKLSGRRATAIYAMLVRDVDLWETLFSSPVGHDDWGMRAIQTMLSRVQSPIGVDGKSGDETRAAIKSFQTANGLGADGVAGPNTRKVLFRAYMDALCGPGLLLDKAADFLARNADGPGGKGDLQGCSEFNPLLMFSKQEAAAFEKTFDKTERNRENAPNRRVMILLFAAGRRVNPGVWPCPRVSEGVAGCQKRFFPDQATRRSFQAARREFDTTKDTFACRFYQIISDDSPCEKVNPVPIQPEVNPLIILAGQTFRAPRQGIVAAAEVKGRNFVIVKKPYTKPARTPITLRSDKPFEGSGEFTVSQSGNLLFFPDADNLLAMRFDGIQNVFTGGQLTAGVTVFAEGAKASKAVDDITLTLTLSAKFATVATVARAEITAVEVILDICAPRVSAGTDPVPLAQPTTATAPPGNPQDKLFGGRILRIQSPAKDRVRAMVIAQLKPEPFATTLELTSNLASVSLFPDENPGSAAAALTLPLPIASNTIPAKGQRFFVQGDVLSKAMRDVVLQLGVKGVEPDCDRVSVTVTAAVEIIRDADKNRVVDQNEPIADFVRFGLWDQAYDGFGNVQNGAAENANFVGSDFRRFYFRVHDPSATANTVDIKWKTLKSDKSDDDAPASQVLTLVETTAGSKIFVSRAVMLVTDDTDRDQATDSGLTAPAGLRNRGQSNHRLRRGRIDGFVKAEYQSTGPLPLTTAEAPIFKRSPDERRRVSVRVINYGGHAAAAQITGQFEHANQRWNQVGIQIDAQAPVVRPIPAGVLDASGQYPGSADNDPERAALADLIPATPDGTLTVVFVRLSGANAYATVAQRLLSALGDRYFIFVNTPLALTDETVAHELHHVLFNRFDVAVGRQFYTFNTSPPGAFGVPLPDDRVYRRIQNLHAPDPDNDAANANILNWAKRVRGARFPIGAGNGAPTDTTGNKFAQNF